MELPLSSRTPAQAAATPAPAGADPRLRAAIAMAMPSARRIGLVLVVSTLIAGFLTALHPDMPFPQHWVYSLCVGLSCYAFVEVGRHTVIRWARRRALERGERRMFPPFRWLVPWLILSAVLGYEVGIVFGNGLLGEHASGMGLFATNRASLAVVLIVTIVATVGTTFWWFACARLAESEARAESAQRAASETQLKLLEAQLEPHMLFNTLANLRVLIGVDPERAQEMLDRLIGFMRTTLNASRAESHPLADEFARAADYLSLMAIRMGHRLQVAIDLPPALRAVPVPPMLLQPLIENAIKHGLEPKVEGGRIEVAARAAGGTLVLTVRDTGVGLSQNAATAGTGFGLSQVRERVGTLYAERGQVALEPATDADGGTVARIVLPMVEPAQAAA